MRRAKKSKPAFYRVGREELRRRREGYIKTIQMILRSEYRFILQMFEDLLVVSNIKRVPATLRSYLSELQRLTGWTFTVMAGGPEPGRGGKLSVSLSVVVSLASTFY